MLLSLPVLLLLCYCSSDVQACSPVEEGHSTTLRCSNLGSSCNWIMLPVLFWYAEAEGDSIVGCDGETCHLDDDKRDTRLILIGNNDEDDVDDDIDNDVANGDEDNDNDVDNDDDVDDDDVMTTMMMMMMMIIMAMGNNRKRFTTSPVYTHTETGETPVYYRSQCSLSVPVGDLGEGTHSFQGYIYPDVSDGEKLVPGLTPSKRIYLKFPRVSQNCSSNTDQGYFLGTTTNCACVVTSYGDPGGTAQWYRAGQRVGAKGILMITYDKTNPEQVYTCEAKSALGRKLRSTLTAKFAHFDSDAVAVESSKFISLCRNLNNNNNSSRSSNSRSNDQALVTCRISREKVSPEPKFSFSTDGHTFDAPQLGTESDDGIYYQRQFSIASDIGADYYVTCRVMNTVLNVSKEETAHIVFRQPPPVPPYITIAGKTYQGLLSSNIVTLAEGYTGKVACRVEGGYPGAHTTQLKCGHLGTTGDGHTATLTFDAHQLDRSMDGQECTCTGLHDSGCYSNSKKKIKLNILYSLQVTFTLNSNLTSLNQGDHLSLNCSAEGNPYPTSVTLTRERTNQTLATVQSGQLTHTLHSLDCLDTDVYVCAGQNSKRIITQEINLGVRCPQQLSKTSTFPSAVDAVLGEATQFSFEVYGFPEPSSLTLKKINAEIDLALSPRHQVTYSASVAPFGIVSITFFDVVQSDLTNYTLTLDNGVKDAQSYMFYLIDAHEHLVERAHRESDAKSPYTTAIIIGFTAIAVIIALIAIIVFLVRKNRRRYSNTSDTGNSDRMNTINMSDVFKVQHKAECIPHTSDHYEDTDAQSPTKLASSITGLPPAQKRNFATDASSCMFFETTQNEITHNMALPSGPYSHTSEQDVEPPHAYSCPEQIYQNLN
ncbi:cell adhesion molecule 3 [Elysia marginata]|uniref:Cell adhesion molecule 3 n=1 Tax=Elysia marginata TaxID=1093978 RepID=A0AAV4FIH7_9GAST|nr:cell adhesion molecule 3 [Elysia marginata]